MLHQAKHKNDYIIGLHDIIDGTAFENYQVEKDEKKNQQNSLVIDIRIFSSNMYLSTIYLINNFLKCLCVCAVQNTNLMEKIAIQKH